MPSDALNSLYDVVVIGGGAAGLNGALMLARSRRSVVMIDAGQPRNAPAEGVHGLLARDGMPPAELIERGRAEVRSYGGAVVTGTVTAVSGTVDTGFRVDLADGRTVGARRVLVTTGLVDELPDVAGLRERWGRDVVHCPYCHGWEVRDQAIGVIASSPMVAHQALLFRQLSDDVTVFVHTAVMGDTDRERLLARGVRLVEGEVAGVGVSDDRITGVRLTGGEVIARSVIAVQTRMVARGGLLAALGLTTVDHPLGMGSAVPADPTGLTSVPGVYVAGNVTDLSAQVGAAAAAGALAGARINADLVDEETRNAVAQRASTREDRVAEQTTSAG